MRRKTMNREHKLDLQQRGIINLHMWIKEEYIQEQNKIKEQQKKRKYNFPIDVCACADDAGILLS